jgi:hypothetical protein
MTHAVRSESKRKVIVNAAIQWPAPRLCVPKEDRLTILDRTRPKWENVIVEGGVAL